MNNDFVNKISSLTIHVFYDTSKDMITAHLINEQSGKADIMAYRLFNGSWDVREVVDEQARLLHDREVVEIFQKPVGIFETGSGFDQLMRKAIDEIEQIEPEDSNSVSLIKEILDEITDGQG